MSIDIRQKRNLDDFSWVLKTDKDNFVLKKDPFCLNIDIVLK